MLLIFEQSEPNCNKQGKKNTLRIYFPTANAPNYSLVGVVGQTLVLCVIMNHTRWYLKMPFKMPIKYVRILYYIECEKKLIFC